MGRRYNMPEINPIQFEKLCRIQCTREEIADFFGVSESYLKKWVKETYNGETFEMIYKKHQAEGKVSIRRSQFYLKNKSPAMAIHLGKVVLGQREPTNDDNAMAIQVIGDVSINGQLATNEIKDDGKK